MIATFTGSNIILRTHYQRTWKRMQHHPTMWTLRTRYERRNQYIGNFLCTESSMQNGHQAGHPSNTTLSQGTTTNNGPKPHSLNFLIQKTQLTQVYTKSYAHLCQILTRITPDHENLTTIWVADKYPATQQSSITLSIDSKPPLTHNKSHFPTLWNPTTISYQMIMSTMIS